MKLQKMKKLILFTILFVGCFVAQAQKSAKTTTFTAAMVSEPVKANFSKEFPGNQPKWEADIKNFKALYSDPKTNSKGIIVYDPDGKVLKCEAEANTIKTPNTP